VTVWLSEIGQHRAQVARLSTLQKTVWASDVAVGIAGQRDWVALD
jgi:hypothetical protein